MDFAENRERGARESFAAVPRATHLPYLLLRSKLFPMGTITERRVPARRLRPDLHQFAAVLLVPVSEALGLAGKLDVRDLNEWELAHLEAVSVRTVRNWRLRGGGPPFRNQGGVRYPVRQWLEWREQGLRKGV